MAKWFTFFLRCCKRHRQSRAVHVLDPETEHHDNGFHRPHRRTYYYSMFSVRLAIMIMLAILIALLTILTWHFTTVYTTRSIKTLAYGLRTELLNRPIARMWNLLNSTVEATVSQVQLSQFVLGQYALPISPDTQLEVHRTMRNVTWALFVSRKSAKTFTVAYRNGQVQAFDRDVTSNSTYYLYTNPANGTALNGAISTSSSPAPAPDSPATLWPDVILNSSNITWYSETVNPTTGIAKSLPIATDAYDFSKDIEDVLSLEKSEVSWRVTVSNFSDTPVLSSAAAIHHPSSGTIVALASITTALSSINQFLRELTSSHSGYLYLTTASGQLLASSTNASLIDTSGPVRTLVLANESSDPVVRAGARWLNERYGFEGLVKSVVHEENIVLEGKRYYIDTFSLVLPRLQMVGVIIIPRPYVMGEVDRRGKATLAILVSISSCILIAGCVSIIFFTSGVSTEMKLRAELINHLDARRQAEASSNYKSQFLANMSHELRTPMAAVIGLLDILLCDECLSCEQVNMVSQIRRCSTALLRLLNNILDISKVESGKLLLDTADFDLNRELEGLMDMFSVQCVDHDIELVLDLAGMYQQLSNVFAYFGVFLTSLKRTDDMPRMVSGDSARTVQIFANLIANAIKFTSAGHVILRGWCGSPNMSTTAMRNGILFGKNDVSWDQSKPDYESVGTKNNQAPRQFLLWFEVEDTGCGIDSSKWEAVFDNFVQADTSTTRTYGGTGLGLCIVRSFVRKMGGDIKIVKKEGPGALLRFYLLFGQPIDSEPDTPRLPIPMELENAKVLLAIKRDVGRGILAQWMHYRGLHVYETSEWDQTIQVLQDLLHREGWENGTRRSEFDAPAANFKKASRPISGSRDIKGITDDEMSLVLSGNPGHWKMQNFKLLAVLDAELIPWFEDSNQIVSFLSVVDEFRDQGIMISWLFTHKTPNGLKTQLRRIGYSITANQPLYKSKVLQLLTSMLSCLERDSSRHSKSDLRVQQVTGISRGNSGYFADIKTAAIERYESEKHQSQAQSKLGRSGANKSLPKMWSSNEFVGVKSYRTGTWNTNEAVPPLHTNAVHLISERHPVARKDLDRAASVDSGRCNVVSSTPLQQPEEQESINLRNLGPAASPGSSPASSNVSSPGRWMKESHPVDTDSLSSALSQEKYRVDRADHNHVENICPALSDLANGYHSETPNSAGASDRTKQRIAGSTLLHDFSNEPSSITRIVDEAVVEDPRPLREQVDQCVKIDSTSVSKTPLHAVGNQTTANFYSSGITSKSVITSASIPSGSRPLSGARPSTQNYDAKRPPVVQLGPSNALAGIRILLAEDTPVLAKVATIMLQKLGARVVSVPDGMEAVETIGRSRGDQSVADNEASSSPLAVEHFDLVLMDCQMPRMDGYDATKAIRKAEEGTNWHLPIVALTAHAMSSDEAKCLQVGMDAYLTKPIDSKLMVSTILGLTRKDTC